MHPPTKKNCELWTHEKATRSGWLIRYFTGNRGVHFNGCVGGYKRYRLFYRRQNNLFNTDIINEDDNPKIIGKAKQENGVYKIASLRTAIADLMHDKPSWSPPVIHNVFI
jgi:hypothetical protein